VAVDACIRTRHLVGDHGRTPQGNAVSTWFAHHPRVGVHFTPVPGAWMKQVAPWGRSRPRQRVRMADVASTAQLQAQRDQLIQEGKQQAQPCNWSTTSVAKLRAAAPALAAYH